MRDAFLAVAAILLATGLPKQETETGLLRAIASQWVSYAAFAASFLFICIAWSNRHKLFIYIRQTDQYLLVPSILFLIFVTLQAFTTGLLTHRVGKSGERIAALIYHGTLVLMTFFPMILGGVTQIGGLSVRSRGRMAAWIIGLWSLLLVPCRLC